MAVTINDASYEVIFDPTPGVNEDITDKIIIIEPCTDVANEVNTAVIQLDAEFGGFLTDADIDGTGHTPILAQFDKIKITFTDKNDNSYSKIFEVDNIFQRRTGSENLRVEVHLLGQEHWLTSMPFAKQFYWENAANIARDIIDIYRVNKGSAQPQIENHDVFTAGNNELPRWTSHTLPFNVTQNMCFDGIKQEVDMLGAPIGAAGSGDFFFWKLNDKLADPSTLQFEAASSGSKPVSPLTVTNAQVTPVHALRGEREKQSGNIVGIKGAFGFGSQPFVFSEFRSIIEAFDLHPNHIPGLTYPAALIPVIATDGLHYRTNKSTSTTPPGIDWDLVVENDFLGTRQYSPYTDNKFALWKNAGSNPDGIGTVDTFDFPGCVDSNMVVLDEDNYRNWVHVKATSEAGIPASYQYPSSNKYRGLRVLVNGTGTGLFAGHNNKIIQYISPTTIRDVGPIGDAGQRAPITDDLCVVKREGFVYRFNGSTWVDDHTSARGNDPIHVYDSIASVQGVTDLDNGLGSNYGVLSGLKVTYKYTPFATFGSSVLTVVNYYSIGCWLNFAYPFPENTLNGIGEDVGEIYGGTLASNQEPATFNTDNLIFTPTGLNGFNQVDSNELFPVTSLDFMARFRWFVTASNEDIVFQGNFKFRCFIYDTDDNVVFQDFVIEHMNHFEQISLPLESFKNYRARAPLRFGNIPSNLIKPELEILNVFIWRNVKLIVIQLQEVYDNEGRFSPEGSRFVLVPVLSGEVATELTVDSWRWSKQAFAISAIQSTRAQFPPFLEAPQVSNIVQLQQLADGQVEIEKHQYIAFETEEEILCDIKSEDSFYLVDSELIPEDDDSSGGIKLVARRIEYSVNAPNGPGGILRRIKPGVKRLV